jgi:hypothetical protein
MCCGKNSHGVLVILASIEPQVMSEIQVQPHCGSLEVLKTLDLTNQSGDLTLVHKVRFAN